MEDSASRGDVLAIIDAAINASVAPAGALRLPVLSESSEQIAIDIVDALESAGFTIAKVNEPQ
jgi:hypothetical protein